MVGDIVRVWGGVGTRAQILVRDHADGVTKGCYIRMLDDIDAWRVSLCKRVLERQLGPVVLTVNPPDAYGCEIVEAELLNRRAVAS